MVPVLGPDDDVGFRVGALLSVEVGAVDTALIGDLVGTVVGDVDGTGTVVGAALGFDDTFIDGLSDEASTGDAEGEELVSFVGWSVPERGIRSPPPQSQHACFAVFPKLANLSP